MEKVKIVLSCNLGFNEQEEFDKCHHVGPVKDGQQTTIVSFKLPQYPLSHTNLRKNSNSRKKEKQQKTKKSKSNFH